MEVERSKASHFSAKRISAPTPCLFDAGSVDIWPHQIVY